MQIAIDSSLSLRRGKTGSGVAAHLCEPAHDLTSWVLVRKARNLCIILGRLGSNC